MPSPLEPRRVSGVLRVTGTVAVIMSAIALILGLVMVETGASDFRATVEVSNDAVAAILDTVDVVSEATEEIQEGIDAASSGVAGVSATAVVGATNLEDVAAFLETDLPENLESIRSSMPAAIQAAGAVDATLRALSFVGVDYNPDEPFDDSLRSVEQALGNLPEDLRNQAESLRELVPVATELGGEADRLSLALIALGDDLEGIQEITSAYNETLTEAGATIANTEATLDRNLWLLRITLVALAFGGGAVGIGLYAVGGFVESLIVDDGGELILVQDTSAV
jgi:hypothetical protein